MIWSESGPGGNNLLEREFKELSLQTRIDLLNSGRKILSGSAPWWEIDGNHSIIDESGGEFNEILRLARENRLEERLPENIIKVRRKKEKGVALVLAGGGALCPVEIGVILALRSYGIPFDFIVGTSAGGISGIVAAFALTLESCLKAKELGETVNWDKLRTKWAVKQGALWSMDKLGEYIDKNLPEMSSKYWQDRLPLAITMVDKSKYPPIQTLRIQWAPFPNTTWGTMVQASCCIPYWMAPTKAGGFRLSDGGVIREGNEPVGVARAIVPEALVFSVRLTQPHNNFPRVEPDFRIEPCLHQRNKRLDMKNFDKGDVKLGYMEGLKVMDELEHLLSERKIKKQFLKGFKTGCLDKYFFT